MTFTWWDQRLPYFDHPHNTTRANERAVEVACALHWLRDTEGNGLEVGNVLAHYDHTGHRVVDRHEQAPGVDNIDLFDIAGSYDWIVTISTVEHVRWDDAKDPAGATAAIDHLQGLLAPGGQMLVTFPTGWHPGLDQAITDGTLDADRVCTFTRHGDDWRQDARPTVSPYGDQTPWATTVCIAEYQCPSTNRT